MAETVQERQLQLWYSFVAVLRNMELIVQLLPLYEL